MAKKTKKKAVKKPSPKRKSPKKEKIETKTSSSPAMLKIVAKMLKEEKKRRTQEYYETIEFEKKLGMI